VSSPFSETHIVEPKTIPPFHTIKAPKKARTMAYGTKDGKISARTFGILKTDPAKSPTRTKEIIIKTRSTIV
jgi:hypothetical protein